MSEAKSPNFIGIWKDATKREHPKGVISIGSNPFGYRENCNEFRFHQKRNNTRKAATGFEEPYGSFHSVQIRSVIVRILVNSYFNEKKVIRKRRRPDLNRCIEALQASALPLGYAAIGKYKVKRETGFEPATTTLAR